MEPVVQKGHEGLVHHILLYECPDSFPTSFLNHSGHCYNETTPREIMECAGQSIVAAWAIGGGVRFEAVRITIIHEVEVNIHHFHRH